MPDLPIERRRKRKDSYLCDEQEKQEEDEEKEKHRRVLLAELEAFYEGCFSGVFRGSAGKIQSKPAFKRHVRVCVFMRDGAHER